MTMIRPRSDVVYGIYRGLPSGTAPVVTSYKSVLVRLNWLFHVFEIEYHFKQYTGVMNTLKVTVSTDRIWYVKQNSYELKTIIYSRNTNTQMHVYQHSFAKCQQACLWKFPKKRHKIGLRICQIMWI